MITVRNNIDFTKIKNSLFNSLKDSLEREAMTVIKEIAERSRSGKDIDGGALPAYSAQYAAVKSAGKAARLSTSARSGKAKSASSGKSTSPKKASVGMKGAVSVSTSAPVNLTVTGNMLNGIKSEVQVNEKNIILRIFFPSAKNAEKARGHMTGTYFGKKTDKVRNFFGLSKEQETRIREGLLKMVRNIR